MDSSISSIRYLPGKSFILSVLLHILVFNIFVFVWPKLPEGYKPQFNFLGSILSASDVMSPIRATEHIGGSLVNYHFQHEASSLFDPRLSKPNRQMNYSPEDKRTVKEIATENATTPEKATINPKDAQIELKIEPYKPLRLKIND